MKLIDYSNRVYFVFALAAFLLGGVLFYFMLKATIYEEVDEALWAAQQQILTDFEASGGPLEGENWKISRLSQAKGGVVIWQDTAIWNAVEEEFIPFRQLILVKQVKGQTIELRAWKSLLESDDLLEVIFISLSLLFATLLLGLFLINQFILKRTWRPFFQTLKSIASYRLSERKPLDFAPANIAEFDQLNQAISELVGQAGKDYEALKNFTENASHEIQTPLAAARSDLDLLLQTGDFKEVQLLHLNSLYTSLKRLSRLNEGLLLLTKIENRQFAFEDKLNLQKLVEEARNRWQELAEMKGHPLSLKGQSELTFQGAPRLLEILLDNLLKNAISHSLPNSQLNLHIEGDKLIVSNLGEPSSVPREAMFERFRKGDPASASLGLGLAICRQICDLHHFELDYFFEEGWHYFVVGFDKIE